MNWTAITASDLNDTKVAALVDALRTAALGDGQSDPSDEIIANVVARIRAEVAGCRNNLLDVDTTKVPKSLKSLACRLILAEMKNRLEIALTEDERSQMGRDEKYLQRIAACEVPIDTPDNPVVADVQSKSGVTLASSTSRRGRGRCGGIAGAGLLRRPDSQEDPGAGVAALHPLTYGLA